jgi:hypothetical protein
MKFLLLLLLCVNSVNGFYLDSVVPDQLKIFNKTTNALDTQLRLLTVMNLMQQVGGQTTILCISFSNGPSIPGTGTNSLRLN